MNYLLGFLILVLAACTGRPDAPPKAQPIHRALSIPKETTSPSPAPPRPIQPKCPLAYHHTSRNGIVLSLVSFDDRDFQLQVADQTNGPGTHWRDARSAAQAQGGVAAINGGFFTPEGKPLGFLISHGQRRGANNRSSLGAGIFLSTPEQSAITRRGQYFQSPHSWGKIQQLMQTGPMLAEQKRPITGLSKNNQRRRCFIAWDGQHHWAIGYAEPCSLKELSRALAGKAPAGFTIQSAVNLDGGRSSDLWVGSQVSGGNHTHRSFLNKPVRNYLIVVPR